MRIEPWRKDLPCLARRCAADVIDRGIAAYNP